MVKNQETKDAAARGITKTHLAMQPKHITMLREGTKTTTLRDMRYNFPIGTIAMCQDPIGKVFSEIIDKKLTRIPKGLTEEICKTEGNYTKENLITELKSYGHKLPKIMYLYTLKVEK